MFWCNNINHFLSLSPFFLWLSLISLESSTGTVIINNYDNVRAVPEFALFLLLETSQHKTIKRANIIIKYKVTISFII
jgi:hypothetical protein